MVDVAQLVRATDCGSVGRGFEPHLPPSKKPDEYPAFLFSIHSGQSPSPTDTPDICFLPSRIRIAIVQKDFKQNLIYPLLK